MSVLVNNKTTVKNKRENYACFVPIKICCGDSGIDCSLCNPLQHSSVGLGYPAAIIPGIGL